MKETVGKIASDLKQKAPDKISVIEQQAAMQEEYMKNLFETIDANYDRYAGSFFIVIETKNEKLLDNIFRNYFFARETCPTPNYDQTVFRYNKELGRIEYIWTVPSREACHHLKKHALEVVTEEQELLKFVLQFADGTLLKICKKWNGEQEDSTLLIKKEKINVI